MEDEFGRLLDRAKAGEEEARGELLSRHLDGLRAYVRLKSGAAIRAQESCSDLVQSVCREALADLAGLECADEAGFRAWLCRVALHKILRRAEYYGAQKRDARARVPWEADGEARVLTAYASFCTPSRDAIVREEVRRIEDAFDRLPESYRDVLLAARIEGRSHREIATATGKSEEAVRQLLTRARARLALLLDGGNS